MAEVAQNRVITSVTDGLKDSSFTVYVQDDVTITGIIALIQALLPLVDSVIQGKIKHSGINISIPLPGSLKDVPTTTADVEEKAVLAFESLGGTPYKLSLPTWDEAHNATGSDTVDEADVDVAALITLVEDGLGGDDFRAYNNEDPLVETLIYQRGYELFVPRKSRASS